MKLLVQNAKIKKSSNGEKIVYNFGIPALKSASGEFTCPNASKCAIGCYAKSGAYLFSNVAKAYEARYQMTLQANFSDLISEELTKIVKNAKTKTVYIRIHDSGDFYSLNYFNKWANVMARFPKVKFYAYTKMVSQFKAIKVLPQNFSLIFSYGGKEDNLIDTNLDRHSKVFESLELLQSSNYDNCSVDDLQVFTTKNVGLVYHGNKKFENTSWGKVA